MTTVTPPADPDQTPAPEYLPNRYDRLAQGARTFISGTDFGDNFINGEIIEALVENLTMVRVLDGLTENDANTVSMLTILDFPRGLPHMAWRITDWLSENRSVSRDDDNEFAVVSVLARIMAIVAAAFVGTEFEDAQQHPPANEGSDQ